MPILRYLSISLASALVASYAALWLANPTPLEQHHSLVRPPLIIEQQGNDLMLWGGWSTVAGYEPPGVNAVEIRCNRDSGRCLEAYASILHHDEGEDLEAQVFNYEVVDWTEQMLHATGVMPHANCVTRSLVVALPAGSASLELLPKGDDCEFDASAAMLVGDPL
ncbi:hypothetical protein LJY18_16880 [Pseudomonas sp. MMS21-TM103]|uniref:hypothetical protein n=1 Tax=Pseudomonas sp. MMS21 TM103 TaxID=2886506 RepID=UPI001EDD83E6|nr:hypothetical protein [Pseudomonas sp. MMS21 TM103]MCG4454953.1 hypothetical protein [Pseudomonas sp. MMS21 TM103]